jgi:TRAP-type mannitol/chloroaromatic compound transport system substrate-binding protein
LILGAGAVEVQASEQNLTDARSRCWTCSHAFVGAIAATLQQRLPQVCCKFTKSFAGLVVATLLDNFLHLSTKVSTMDGGRFYNRLESVTIYNFE